MNAANLRAPCPYSGTWRTQLPGWVSKSEERHPEHLGQTEAQVAIGVQFGLLQIPSPRVNSPGNEAIPEHRVSGTPRWAWANEGQKAGVMKSEIGPPAQMRWKKLLQFHAGVPRHSLVNQSQMCPQSCCPSRQSRDFHIWPSWGNGLLPG